MGAARRRRYLKITMLTQFTNTNVLLQEVLNDVEKYLSSSQDSNATILFGHYPSSVVGSERSRLKQLMRSVQGSPFSWKQICLHLYLDTLCSVSLHVGLVDIFVFQNVMPTHHAI